MIIKNNTSSKFSNQKKISWPILVILLSGTILAFIFFFAGVVTQKHSLLGTVKQNALLLTDGILIKLIKNKPDLPILKVDMKFKHYHKIEKKRSEAIEKELLVTASDDFVPAEISVNGNINKVKMRLKGDGLDHLDSEKWSFRVHVKNGKHILGMSRFSLQHPKVRNFVFEWAWLEHLRMEDILAVRYQFVDLIFNGQFKGVYALEEHFSKELMESHKRREGIILAYDESRLWENFLEKVPYSKLSFKDVNIKVRSESKILENPVLYKQLQSAKNLFEGFKSGRLKPSEVFDVELMARFLAICDFWSAYHVLQWHNVNFYYNPISARLEPIGFDGYPIPASNVDDDMPGVFSYLSHAKALTGSIKSILEDPIIVEEYLKQLNIYSSDTYFEKIRRKLEPRIEKNTLAIFKDLPIESTTRPILLQKAFDQIKEKLDTFKKVFNQDSYVHANIINYGGNIQNIPEKLIIEIRSKYDLPIEVHSFVIGEKIYFAKEHLNTSGELITQKDKDNSVLILTSMASLKNDNIVRFLIPVSPNIRDYLQKKEPLDISVKCKILGAPKFIKEKVISYVESLEKPSTTPDPISLEEISAHFPFIKHEDDLNEFCIPSGTWKIHRDLVIPSNYSLKIDAGAHLQFDRNVILFSESPIYINGNKESPVIFKGIKDAWGGIVISNAKKKSILKYAMFYNTLGIGKHINPLGIDKEGWFQTGGITFYKSPVELSYCSFKQSKAEDILNIFNTTFSMDKCVFKGGFSDGFDGDFVKGVIRNCEFKEISGDAIDFSGSNIKVRTTFFKDIGDKAISAGEATYLEAYDIQIKDTGIGIASKDGSKVKIFGGKVESAKVTAFAAYRKKSEYGSSTIEAKNVNVVNTDCKILVEDESSVLINSEEFKGKDYNIKQLYEDGILGN